MIDRDIIIAHLVLADAENEIQSSALVTHWNKHVDGMSTSEHSGDCTKDPWTCSRCVIEEAQSMIPVYRKLFGV
jgi:hypothetical protein